MSVEKRCVLTALTVTEFLLRWTAVLATEIDEFGARAAAISGLVQSLRVVVSISNFDF